MYHITSLLLYLFATSSVVQSIPLLVDTLRPSLPVSKAGLDGNTMAVPYTLTFADRFDRLGNIETTQLMYRRGGKGATPPPTGAGKKTEDPPKQQGSTSAEKGDHNNAANQDAKASSSVTQGHAGKQKCPPRKPKRTGKVTKTLSARMEEGESSGQYAQQAEETRPNIPRGRDRGNTPVTLGDRITGPTVSQFGKVYRHRSSRSTIIKVVGPKTGWSDEARLAMVEKEVAGLISAGQYKNEWGWYYYHRKLYFYIYMKYIPGLPVDHWAPYIAVQTDEAQRVPLVQRVVERVKQKAWEYYVHFGILHSDPHPGNVLVTGTAENPQVDFIDWADPRHNCIMDEAGLDAEIDMFWYEMFERHADSSESPRSGASGS